MPGEQGSYDLIRTKDERSNSKADTFFITPRGVGNTSSQIEQLVTKRIDGDLTGGTEITSLVGTNLSVSGSGELEASGGAPADAEYVVLSNNPDLSNEQVHANLSSGDLHPPKSHASTHEKGGSDTLTTFGDTTHDSVTTPSLSHGIEKGSEVSGSRSVNTEYQNTSGETLYVIVQVGAGASGDSLNAALEAAPSSGLSFAEDNWDYRREESDTGNEIYTYRAQVEDGGYYQLETFPGNDWTIQNWWERGKA